MDLLVAGHDGNGVYSSVTEGITGASGASTDGNGWERWVQLGEQREPLGHLGQKIGMSTSIRQMTASAPPLDSSSRMHTHGHVKRAKRSRSLRKCGVSGEDTSENC